MFAWVDSCGGLVGGEGAGAALGDFARPSEMLTGLAGMVV